jgi:hypothetical protein
MRTIKQDTANHFYRFRDRKYARILREAQKAKTKAEDKNETRQIS